MPIITKFVNSSYPVRDYDVNLIHNYVLSEGVMKDKYNECKTAPIGVDTGIVLIPVKRTAVNPAEEFMVVVEVTEQILIPAASRTAGKLIILINQEKINNGLLIDNNSSNVAELKIVADLPTTNFHHLGTYTSHAEIIDPGEWDYNGAIILGNQNADLAYSTMVQSVIIGEAPNTYTLQEESGYHLEKNESSQDQIVIDGDYQSVPGENNSTRLPSADYQLTINYLTFTPTYQWCELAQRIFPNSIYSDLAVGGPNEYAISIPGFKGLKDNFRVVFRANAVNTGPATLQINDEDPVDLVKGDGVDLAAGDITNGFLVEAGYSASQNRFQILNPLATEGLGDTGQPGGIGGTGEDGALDTTEGPIEIDLEGENQVIFNWSVVNVVGGNNVTFINPAENGTRIIMRCLGNFNVDGAVIDATGLGARGGLGGGKVGNPNTPDGQDGLDGFGIPGSGYAGRGGVSWRHPFVEPTPANGGSSHDMEGVAEPETRALIVYCGSGGGGGSQANEHDPYDGPDSDNFGVCPDAGDGGRGGPGIIIEVGGRLDLVQANCVMANGEQGEQGGSNGFGRSGPGGGGSGGIVLAIYNIEGVIHTDAINVDFGAGQDGLDGLTSFDSGVVHSSGGSAGSGAGGKNPGGDGGIGASASRTSDTGIAVDNENSVADSGSSDGGTPVSLGNNPPASTHIASAAASGSGSDGYYRVVKNTFFN